MRWEDFRASTNVEDRRGGGGIPGGAGGLGIGGVIVLTLVGWALGIDPRVLISGVEQMGGGRAPTEQAQPRGQGGQPTDEAGRFATKILGQTEDVWRQVLPEQLNRQYKPAKMVLFSGSVSSACGAASAQMGPFYCPRNETIYIDLSFFQEMERRFRAGGDFAYAYVIAHEVGHHVENQLDILGKVQARQQEVGDRESNQLSVRVELMADCLAGVWANKSQKALEDGDIDEGLNAAAAIGDDRLQKQSQGYVTPDSFTHGSSEQRKRWFMTGYRGGQVQQCDTFRTNRI